VARPERALRQHLRRSAPVKLELVRTVPELTAQEESFYKIARELPPLFERHYQELALDKDQFPLDPDWDRYFGMAATGTLRITTARFGEVLAGYIFNLVGPHLHYKSSLHGHIEMFWLDPAYRGGVFALRWFRENEKMLKDLGVKRVTVDEKHHFKDGRVGLIFRRLCYRPVETTFSKVL
jgi:GNAT superfamily N-acetyltransferase